MTTHDELMVKYFSGEATPEEIDRLSVWLSSDPLNKKAFEENWNVWLLAAKEAMSSQTDIDKEWYSFKEKAGIKAGQNEPVKSRRFYIGSRMLAAASVIIILALAGILYYLNLKPSITEAYAENGLREITLADGSKVVLGEGSRLSFPVEFKGTDREVTLTGEAHFSVSHDAKHPFIVTGNNLNIKVLGTEFAVNTHTADGNMNVVLESGKVSLSFRGKEKDNLILEPGEIAKVNPDKESIQVTENTDLNYKAWMTGLIRFENTSLTEVASTLSEIFKKEIRLLNGELSSCTLTATFRNQSLEEVMAVIEATLDVKSVQKDNVIYLDGSCK